MIAITGLTKRYGETLALDRLDLTIPDGAVFGLLGPNGSGKTTVIKLLMGLIFADAGQIEGGGVEPCQAGYLPERLALPPRCRVAEHARLIGRLSGLRGPALQRAVDEALRQAGLADVAGQHIGACSKGTLQRLGLALTLLGDPRLVVLDEPLEGLDPAWQKAVRDRIRALHAAGKTVVLSTHRLADVVELCTDVAILREGRLKRAGTLAQVLPPRPRIVITVDRLPDSAAADLATRPEVVAIDGNIITLAGDSPTLRRAVVQDLLDAGADVLSLAQERASLEAIYLEAVRS